MRSKCPICKGNENNRWLSHIETRGKTEYAVFIVECWSGNSSKQSKYHIYKKRVKLSNTVEIDQLVELNKQYDTLQDTSYKRMDELERELIKSDEENERLAESLKEALKLIKTIKPEE